MPKETFFNLPIDKQERIMKAVINEMGLHTYEHININSIIKEASIPRGSFYQYFEDKNDMYTYFYQYIGEKKFKYWGPLLNFEIDMPFMERFYAIYKKGIDFMLDYPDLVKAGQKVISSDFLKHNEQFKKSMQMAIDLYAKYIEIDQKKDRIRNDIDPKFLASVLLDMLNRTTLEDYMQNQISAENIEKHVTMIINLLEKGIKPHV
jgi:AcrR family transcriptional regulator